MKTKNKSFKRLFAFLVALVMVTALVPSVIFAAEPTFPDVPADYWAYDYIETLAAKKVVGGYADGTFGPKNNVTRQQAAKMIAKAAGLEASAAFVSKFSDFDKVASDLKPFVLAVEEHKVVGGFPDGSFGPRENIKRSQAAKMIVLAFGLTKGENPVDFDDPVADATDQSYIDILASNGIVKGYEEGGKTLYKPSNLVTREQLAKMIVEAMELELEILEVSAINAKALKVTFNSAVDTEKAVFAVKRGNTVVATTATWNEAKTEATLTASVKLVAGDYTVTVTGVETEEGKNVATTTVAPERIDKIELDNNAYGTGTPGDVTVAYKLFNQYDEDVTKNHAVTNFTVTSSVGNITSDQPSAVGVITITGLGTAKELTVTLVDKVFAKTASKVVAVQSQKALAKITLNQPEIPTGKDKIEGTATDVVIPYEATDQFGGKVELASTTGLTVISSDTTALPNVNVQVKTINGKYKLVIVSFGAFNGKKDITLTVIVNATGEVGKVTFPVYGTATAKTPTLVAPTNNPGIGENPFNIELKMADVYGNEMKAADVAKLTTTDVTIISSNESIFTIAGSKKPQLVDKKSVVQITPVAEGTANLMITVNATGETSTLAVTVVEAKYPASMTLSLDKDVVAKDGKVTLKATFKDQFGNEIKESANIVRLKADNADFTPDYTTANDASTVTSLAKTGVEFTATDWKKTTKITAELVNGTSYDAAKVVNKKEITLQSTKADAEYTYTIKEVPTLYGGSTGKVTGHTHEIELIAKDVNGKTVALPAGYVTHITTTNSDFTVVTGAMTVEATDKGTATIALWKGATKLAEVEVTASDVVPAADTIKFKKEEITIDGKAAAGALSDIKAQLEIKDQYGVAIAPVGGTSGMWTSDKAEIAFTNDTISTYGVVTDATIGFITNNGKSATMKVTITDAK